MTDDYYPELGRITEMLARIGPALDAKVATPPADPIAHRDQWEGLRTEALPLEPSPLDDVVAELVDRLIPHGGRVTDPGFWSFITNGPSTAPYIGYAAAMIAAPVRYGYQAFNAVEERTLEWLAEITGVGPEFKGLYTSGGSTANLVAMGAARQSAFESRVVDPAREGLTARCGIYASPETHHTIQRSAAVLGLGRDSVREVAVDDGLRMVPEALAAAIDADVAAGIVPVAVVANGGSTNTGTIDRLRAVGDVARSRGVWFHVDGAYGLVGHLDERVRPRYDGLSEADSAIVDPHKWLAAAPGTGVVFVRDRALLQRAFTQGPADYLEGSFANDGRIESSADTAGIPYGDFGVELTAPSRGISVWALLREQGVSGVAARIRRDNDFASHVSRSAREHPRLESLTEPDLSIACVRYVGDGTLSEAALDAVNQRIHRRLVRETEFLPSTTIVRGRFVIRPCFISPRATWPLVEAFLPTVVRLGDEETA